jgi:hypothetical protein
MKRMRSDWAIALPINACLAASRTADALSTRILSLRGESQ